MFILTFYLFLVYGTRIQKLSSPFRYTLYNGMQATDMG
jgi:hypothetical protein